MASLYLHIPFCERKCIYCDFYSIENLKPMQTFVEAIVAEIGMYHSYSYREPIETIFLGGGTPSLLPADSLVKIFTALRQNFDILDNAEITLEANPGTIDQEKFFQYRKLGINRLSFGVQSFHQNELDFLGRIHNSEQAINAVTLARNAGFDNINIDLIFALPKQTMDAWQDNLEKALTLKTQHISAYSLIIEPNTPLQRLVESKQVTPCPTEHEADMYEFTMEFLHNHGFEHYEVSNYAYKGFSSKHNRNYWNHTNYLGFGPAAHSFWGSRRWWNVKNLQLYIDRVAEGKLPVEGDEHLTRHQLFDETIMLGLRSSGVALEIVQSEFGVNLLENHNVRIKDLISEGLVELSQNSLRLTPTGFLLCDSIAQSLLTEPSAIPFEPIQSLAS